jgi:hypothetical protein
MIIVFLIHYIPCFNLVQYAEAQMNMNSFLARGIINIPLTHTPLLNDQQINNSKLVSDQLTNSNASMELDTNKNLPYLRGQWAFEVNKGEVKSFRVIFTIVQNDKIVNAFGLFNLTDTKYIQLNDKGTEIITGTVDLTSVGLKNETIFNIPATITVTSLTQLRIALDQNIMQSYFTDPIIGATRLLTDASGNMIIGPRPSPNPPQSNSFYDPNIF